MSERSGKRFPNWQPPEFDENGMTKWGWMCQHHKNLKIGDQSDVGAFTYINASNGVVIGREVEIGSHCSIYSVSTIDGKRGLVHIKRNAKIGTHSTIMPGVTVGENSIVGAYSFVTKDIPPNVLAYGIPAKVIRKINAKKEK